MNRGTVKFFDTNRGFGFITPEDGTPDVFFHVRALTDRGAESALVPGAHVEYMVEVGHDRRLRAANVGLVA